MGLLDVTAVGTSYLLKKFTQVFLIILILFILVSLRAPMLSKTYLYTIFRDISKAQMMWITRNWHQLEGEHFVVRYKAIDEAEAPLVLEAAEEAYLPVKMDFAYEPKEKILIVMYPNRESLSRSFGWDADESAMGVYWAGVIRILSPSEWIEADSYDDMSAVFKQRGPMAHEFTHLVVDYVTKGNYARWFTEGIALYQEFKINKSVEEEYTKTIDSRTLYPLSQMDREFDSLEDQSLAYRQSYEAVRYIIEEYGETKLWEILLRLSAGETMNQSFYNALGISLDQFEMEVMEWVTLP